MSKEELLLHAPRRRTLVWAGLIVAVGVGLGVWKTHSDNASATSAALLPTVKVTRADLTVSVGGVGRIVERNASAQIAVPGGSSAGSGSASGSSSSGSGTVSAPGDAVFPRANGHISRLLIQPGEHVGANQPIAVIDDGGAAAAAAAQAQNDLETAQVELQQKLAQDPLRGFPATPAEIAAAKYAVKAANQKLARLFVPPRPADVATARADLKKSEADLETLRGSASARAARARAIELARAAIKLNEEKLAKVLQPANPADIAQAEADLKKAIADKAALVRLPPAPTPAAFAAAGLAVSLAQDRLAKVSGPTDPIVLQQANQDLKQAYADLNTLQNQKPPATSYQLDAAQAVVDTMSYKLQKLLAGPDPLEVEAAQADLAKAQAELTALSVQPPPPSPEALAAANEAITAVKTKLARLKAPPNPADVESARVDLQTAKVNLQNLLAGPAPGALASAEDAIAASKARLRQLYAPPLRSDVSAAKLDVSRAKADLAALLARHAPASTYDIRLTNLKIQGAQERLAVAQAAIRQLTVRSTTGGTVTSLMTRVGAPVDGSTPIATVSDLADLAVSVNLSEFDAAQVKPGLRARVSVDALGGKLFLGKVMFAALSGSDNGTGVVTFPVEVALDNLKGVKPGMNASVRIIIAERRNVVEVPLEAVTKDGEDRSVVTVINAAGRTALKPVKLGLANNKNVEIVMGVRAGERIVIAPSDEGGD